MSVLRGLPEIPDLAKTEYEDCPETDFAAVCVHGKPSGAEDGNISCLGENLAFMKYLMREKDMAGKIRMIYADPPFFSKARYQAAVKIDTDIAGTAPVIKQEAYTDTFNGSMDEYLTMLCARFYAFRDLLADDGLLCVHLDWHVVHYVKVMLDEIFGADRFVNEVIWNYKSGGAAKKRFARKHDTILIYSKNADYFFRPQYEKSYNRGFKPYRFKGVKEYRDDTGWYTMVNMKDVWQLDMVGRTSAERTGYATQKPESLMLRLIESCTEKGDICADFFGGAGTLAAAADKAGRRWITCDIGRFAAVNTEKRLAEAGSSFTVMCAGGEPAGTVADVSFEIEEKDTLMSGGKLVTVRLESFALGENAVVPVSGEARAVIDEVLRKDPLSLVDCWSVDTSYDGRVHRASAFFGRGRQGLTLGYEAIIRGEGRVSVRATDIFGNTALTELRV